MKMGPMSRKTDCLLSTETYLHIVNRGVDRGIIFFRTSDYEYFLELMARALPGSDVQLLLYILMPNHFHMVAIQHSRYAISFYMKKVCEAYAKYVNRLRARSGHLFQDRFKVDMLKDPGALLRMSRYIHFNPVEAGLASSFFDWRFGSGRIYMGIESSLL